MKAMKKIPVTKPYFSDKETQSIAEALSSGWVAQGPRVAEFEKEIAKHEGVAEGVATTSCTTALHLAMVAEGLGHGMDAIAPAFTFVATENAILQTGAAPVMVDVRQDTFNIDIEQLRKKIETDYRKDGDTLVNKKSGNALWGIVPVHEFGLCCDIKAVNEIAKEYHLKVIEDAACALGSMIDGVHPGGFDNTACISFHPRKSITTGEGGMILINDPQLAKRMRELRTHGSTVSADSRDKGRGFLLPENNEAGFNYRMTDIQGAMGLAQVKKLDEIIVKKREKVDFYNKVLSTIPELITPVEPDGYFHTYQSYVCMLNSKVCKFTDIEEGGKIRNKLMEGLEDMGISTRQGTHAVHLLGFYRNKYAYKPMDFEGAYSCDRLSISLPLYYNLEEDDIEYIAETIKKVLRSI